MGYLTKYCSVLPQFVAMVFFYKMQTIDVKMAQIGAVGGEKW